MKTLAIIAALATTVAVPAFAQSPLEIAVANHNESADSISDRTTLPVSDLTVGTTVSARNSSALATAIAIRNESAETPFDRINPDYLTTFSGTPAYGAEIFKQLAEESRGSNN